MSKSPIKAYCDGACKGNPGVGGWGCFFDIEVEGLYFRYNAYGGKLHTTSTEMEIKALERLLEILPVGRDVTIHIDNVYVVNTLVKNKDGERLEKKKITGWIGAWRSNGWKKANGDVPAHLGLWQKILEKIKTHLDGGATITIKWVKGHSGDEGNDTADSLANKGCAEIMTKNESNDYLYFDT